MYCLHSPFETIGFPFMGKKVLTTSQLPANCASSFWPAPGPFGGSYSLWVCCATATEAISKAAIVHFLIARDDRRKSQILHASARREPARCSCRYAGFFGA